MNKSLHRLDLNLLIILQYLLEERSVSLVAARLAVTPSAVSKALTKLRTGLMIRCLSAVRRVNTDTADAAS